MKFLAVALVCFAMAGCSYYLPDERVVGHFQAGSGETVQIRSDGRIFYVHDQREEFVGMVTVTRDAPLTIFVVGPDTSPLVGTIIVFSADRKSIEVEWPDWQAALHGRGSPTKFRKE